jgi:phosphate transport system protein
MALTTPASISPILLQVNELRTIVKNHKDGKVLFQIAEKMDMSDFSVRTDSASPYLRLIDQTAEACRIAKEAAAIAAEGIATGSQIVLNSLRDYENELDKLDREIDAGVTSAITQVNEPEARELLACMKFAIGLERIGDLLLSVGSSAQAAGALDPQDTRDLIRMATMLEKMLADVGTAFTSRDLTKAIDVLKSDAEMDRLRGLLFMRHIENPENVDRKASLQIVFMTQSLERAGDHAKNLAEEVCHFVSGRTVRHVLKTYDKPLEQIFLDWLQQCESKR